MWDSGGSTPFTDAVKPALEHALEAASADIAALYPYDEETDRFYAPLSVGLAVGDPIRALRDLNEQLRHFRADEDDSKIPDDLSPANYGTSAWLVATRKPLVSADALHEADSSFVRRHRISAIIGLPLVVGERLVGLLYFDFIQGDREAKRVSSDEFLHGVQEEADTVALALDAARRHAETATIRSLTHLAERVAANTDPDAVLSAIVEASGIGAAAVYGRSGRHLHLVAQSGIPALSARAADIAAEGDDQLTAEVSEVLRDSGLQVVRALVLGDEQGTLLLADSDPLVLDRQAPEYDALLAASANLLASVLDRSDLSESLGETSRTLSAVTQLSTHLLRPGTTVSEALQAAVTALTDPGLPELNFDHAAIYLLDRGEDGHLMVSEGAAASGSNAMTTVSLPTESRDVSPGDVLSYVSGRDRVLVVGPSRSGDRDSLLVGYREDELERLRVPVVAPNGSVEEQVQAIRLRRLADGAGLAAEREPVMLTPSAGELTLDGPLFRKHRHAELLRVFVPFGRLDGHALGVLEAGFEAARHAQLDRVQIEALRASAASIAGAIEAARLHEGLAVRAQQLQMVNEVSQAIAMSIDLEQTLSLVARNMARAVDTSVCLIALLDEDGSAWYGAAASDMEEVWLHRRVERPERNIVFEAADLERPIVVEDAQDHELVSGYMARLLRIRSLLALPLNTPEGPIGAVVLGERDRKRVFTSDEVERATGLANQAAVAIRNARLHAREEEEQHIQKDVVLIGFGQWGQKAYKHLVLLKNFFNFRIHIVEQDSPGRREALADALEMVEANGDLLYWDSADSPALPTLSAELEPSCYVITYIVTPAETHLPVLKRYYDLSNVVLIEKPLGAPPEQYRDFLDSVDGSVQIVAADHYWFKMEVRLLDLLLTEERNLRAFLDEIEDVEIEILEAQPPGGSGAQIGMIADLIPHAFAILSLLTPLDRLTLAPDTPLQLGRFEPVRSERETYARLSGAFEHRGRTVRVTIDVGKGVANAKWIKLTGPRRMGGRRSFYKFDFVDGVAMDGTQGALRAAVRPIRQPGVPDNAHLNMLRHVIEKKHPAVGVLSIREALRANARVRELERMAGELIAAGQWVAYTEGQRPQFTPAEPMRMPDSSETLEVNEPTQSRL